MSHCRKLAQLSNVRTSRVESDVFCIAALIIIFFLGAVKFLSMEVIKLPSGKFFKKLTQHQENSNPKRCFLTVLKSGSCICAW